LEKINQKDFEEGYGQAWDIEYDSSDNDESYSARHKKM